MRELLELTKYNNAELKLTVIADLITFNKKRGREDSGIKRRDTILQRSRDSEGAKTADIELVKFTKLEDKFAEIYTLLRRLGKGGTVPPDTLEIIDVMINNESLKMRLTFSKQKVENSNTGALKP